MAPFSLDPVQQTVPFGEYIFRRIELLGVKSVFGVPGDFNLGLLEHIYSTNVQWYGGCNELNAGYAADGYARASHKFGVLVTTFGVGSLSAMNACCGAWSEFVPLLHIVGATSTAQQLSGQLIHHVAPKSTLSRPVNHSIYAEMVEPIACKVESIMSLDKAPEKFDYLLKEIIDTKKPGYLFLPCDLVDKPVDASRLETVDLFKPIEPVPNGLAYQIASLVLSKLYSSARPVVLGDILTDRFGLTETLRNFVQATKIPNLSTFMGKSILDETLPWYVGEYNGNVSNPDSQKFVQSCDLMLHVGNYPNEINSGHYTFYQNINDVIYMNHEGVTIGGRRVNVSFVYVLPLVLKMLNVFKLKPFRIPSLNREIKQVQSNTPISQTQLISSLQKMVKEDDTLVVDTGTVMFGLPDLQLPKNTRLIGQHFYLSIGMALPCSFGVAVAQRENGSNSRLILLEGDGAAQMTIQELSAFIKYGFSPLILVLNNSGYTVERAIKGPMREYNDAMPNWKWTRILEVFGSNDSESVKVREVADLESEIKSFGLKIKLIEIELDKMDTPWRFDSMCN
ncbi:hypothetical protein OGAPHI_000514 [Ogataea philodendri]|uniref:Phenylpyruvate decarboxylase n=1 Tax=Ogataea philodendri TaxID=1378263 RepID=A0A9P8PG28_9ASCO|nr:uncharacterized protein OGAPHI_000514 [Ogataea philodendri]KAH3671291.1 hypothetical protein OGAPHI_000514 [Ogataea philodendri]